MLLVEQRHSPIDCWRPSPAHLTSSSQHVTEVMSPIPLLARLSPVSPFVIWLKMIQSQLTPSPLSAALQCYITHNQLVQLYTLQETLCCFKCMKICNLLRYLLWQAGWQVCLYEICENICLNSGYSDSFSFHLMAYITLLVMTYLFIEVLNFHSYVNIVNKGPLLNTKVHNISRPFLCILVNGVVFS